MVQQKELHMMSSREEFMTRVIDPSRFSPKGRIFGTNSEPEQKEGRGAEQSPWPLTL